MESSNGQSYKPFLANLDQISFMLSFQLFLTQFNGRIIPLKKTKIKINF